MIKKYRFETGKVYEYCVKQKAYVFYCNKIALSKSEINEMRKETV